MNRWQGTYLSIFIYWLFRIFSGSGHLGIHCRDLPQWSKGHRTIGREFYPLDHGCSDRSYFSSFDRCYGSWKYLCPFCLDDDISMDICLCLDARDERTYPRRFGTISLTFFSKQLSSWMSRFEILKSIGLSNQRRSHYFDNWRSCRESISSAILNNFTYLTLSLGSFTKGSG